MVIPITGTTNKPISSERLKDFFLTHSEYSGYLYIGYPIIGTVEGAYPIDAIWVSKEKGVIIFNLVEGKQLTDYESDQDDAFNKIEAKLKGHRELVDKRKLQVEINVVTFAPAIVTVSDCEDYPLCNETNISNIIDSYSWSRPEYYERLVSVLQSVSSIRKGKKKREVTNTFSRGAKLQSLEDSVANLDNAQGRAVIETVEGVQRIRGLAGSGKTIVLALKAAYLHAQHPEWKIAITFNTRSLKGQLKRLINSFYIEQTSMEPDWDNMEIIHAWGSNSRSPGIYYKFCIEHEIPWQDYNSAKNSYGRNAAFTGACRKALSEVPDPHKMYDVILVDEAQDFPIEFLRMCYEILDEPKRLVYAYDELQNLNLQSLPAPEIIFGSYSNGRPRVKFNYDHDGTSKQDIILEKCYRNSRPALVTAHALGFGIYREPDAYSGTGLVQMFEQKSLWQDIGYTVTEGELKDLEHVVLARTENSSPYFLESHSEIDDLILFRTFSSPQEQNQWVAEQIVKNLREDDLRPDDIIVINPNPLNTREKVGPIRALLYEAGIQSHIAGVDSSPDVFFDSENESVAFTGIFRAKGNEAAMVYVINADDCYQSPQLAFLNSDNAKRRNRLFTAITRSKAWVRVVGVGSDMKRLQEEYERVKENDFTLSFVYPDESQRKRLNIVNRDVSSAEMENIAKRRQSMGDLLADLESGRIYVEDLGAEHIARLKKLLGDDHL